jgi:hypothetical protein
MSKNKIVYVLHSDFFSIYAFHDSRLLIRSKQKILQRQHSCVGIIKSIYLYLSFAFTTLIKKSTTNMKLDTFVELKYFFSEEK